MSTGPGNGAERAARARAVLVAAGCSSRMGGGTRKPLIELAGRTLLETVLGVLDAARTVEAVVVLAHAQDVEAVRARLEGLALARKVRAVLPGGAERADSVRIGVRHALEGPEPPLVAIHDAARPFVRPEEVDAVVERAARTGAALLAVPVRDTLKHSDDGERVERTVDRSCLWAAQTPQVFERERFLACLARAEDEGLAPTDDAALWERHVGGVAIVRGSVRNLKVTESEDLELARALLERAEASPS